jgi:hypothetical protein
MTNKTETNNCSRKEIYLWHLRVIFLYVLKLLLTGGTIRKNMHRTWYHGSGI